MNKNNTVDICEEKFMYVTPGKRDFSDVKTSQRQWGRIQRLPRSYRTNCLSDHDRMTWTQSNDRGRIFLSLRDSLWTSLFRQSRQIMQPLTMIDWRDRVSQRRLERRRTT
jgi:hypothetical protein